MKGQDEEEDLIRYNTYSLYEILMPGLLQLFDMTAER